MTNLEIVFVIALVAKISMGCLLEALNRQRVRQFGHEAPEDLSDVMDAETYAKSNRYTLTKSRFSSF